MNRTYQSMDITSPKGTKVIFTGDNGYESDKKHANNHLKISDIYTVKEIIVDYFSATVCFDELPGILFNTVHFEVVANHT